MGMRDAGRLLKRRGVVAGVAALVGGGLVQHIAADRAEATHTLGGTPNADSNAIHDAPTNQAHGDVGLVRFGSIFTSSFGISQITGTIAALTGISSDSRGRFGVLGTIGPVSNGPAVLIPDAPVAGIWGISTIPDATGVRGEVAGPTSNTGSGVVGIAAGCSFGNGTNVGVGGSGRNNDGVTGARTGVLGITGSTGIGVEGWATNGGTGIRGSANFGGGPDFSGSGIGVEGRSGSGYGVRGESTSGIGVYGQSTNSYGCGGATSQPGYAGLFGYAGVASAAGFLGVNGAPGGTAGYFHGAVTVDGPFQVVNGPKNALVAHPDGSLRRMYCQESPEPWFEDFGRSQLQNGRATVRVDPDFAAVSKSDDYEVFVTPKGACEGLYIANQTPAGFEVHELRGGTSSVPFSYRVVARRKDDVGRRMEKVDLPKFDLRPPGPPATPPGQDKRPPR